jgi:carbon monoxide dehydrogenase subunit G
MIEAEHTLVINTGIKNVWGYVQDIRKWANLFPGCRECDVVDEHNSRWTIKVGAGGLVKTVNVLVHIDEWAGPERVDFSYKLESEPVVGSGNYIASKLDANSTQITLKLQVHGSGAMAPMWEAVGRPLLPQMAKVFSSKLKSDIEANSPVTEEVIVATATRPSQSPSFFAAISNWLRNLWRTIFGPAAH